MAVLNYQILCPHRQHLKILSVSVLGWLVVLVGCKINDKNDLEVRESEN